MNRTCNGLTCTTPPPHVLVTVCHYSDTFLQQILIAAVLCSLHTSRRLSHARPFHFHSHSQMFTGAGNELRRCFLSAMVYHPTLHSLSHLQRSRHTPGNGRSIVNVIYRFGDADDAAFRCWIVLYGGTWADVEILYTARAVDEVILQLVYKQNKTKKK